jgi:hypothetical protein
MVYGNKIVLVSRAGYDPRLDELVRQFVDNGVKFVGVVGVDCELIEEIIDELVVGDGSDRTAYILTSAHPRETVVKAIKFAEGLDGDYAGQVQVVEL